MGESENSESDFVRVMTSLFKDDIEIAVRTVVNNRIKPTFKQTMNASLKDMVDLLTGNTPTVSNTPAGSVQVQKTNYSAAYKTTGMIPKTTVTTLGSPVNSQSALPASTSTNSVSNTNYNGLPNSVIVPTYNDAVNVVNFMNDVIREEGEVTVNDLFDCAGKANEIAGNSAATRYGWTNIDGHIINETPDGQYILMMPKYSYLRKEN